MTALAGPLLPLKFDGVFCLKVHSRILFLTAVTSGESRRVQWHYEINLMNKLRHHGTEKTRESDDISDDS